MPELPEVETIRLGLQKYLVGHKILDVEIKVPKIFQGDKKNVIGARVVGVDRVGKGLIIELSNSYALGVHLKLTGQLVYHGKETQDVHLSAKTGGSLPSKYTHVIFKLKAQEEEFDYLYFNDMRKFGWIKVVKKDQIRELPFFKEMGPEPPAVNSYSSSEKRSDESRSLKANSSGQARTILTRDKFRKIVFSSGQPIKVLLMDQKKISGIGNIYANEALFLARIDPRRRSKDLSDKEINKLYGSIIEVLKRGLKYGGSSDLNFVNAIGEDGNYQNHFLVYGRKGEKCKGCKGEVEKIQLGGRGTYFCPDCQR